MYQSNYCLKNIEHRCRLKENKVRQKICYSAWDEKQLSAVKRIRNKKIELKNFGGPGSGRQPEGGGDESGVGENTSAAIDMESSIRNNDGETGMAFIGGKAVPDVIKENKAKIVLLDDEKMTAISADDRLKMTLTHNHPLDKNGDLGGSFSPGDFEMSAKYGIGEVRAVDGEYTYSLKWNGGKRDDFSFRGNKESRSISTAHDKNIKKAWSDKKKEILASNPTDINSANKEYMSWCRSEGIHQETEKTANQFGFTYKRQKN